MQNRIFSIILPSFAISLMVCADSQTIQVPEGKLTSHTTAFGDITPSAGPRVIEGCGVYLTGDYLYWTAREDNLSFAISGLQVTPSSSTGKGHKYSPRFKYTSGFKGGIGFDFGHDKWDMYMNYTWLNPHHNHKTVHSSKDSILVNNIIALTSLESLQSARASWSLNFNVIDWELGRNFYISKFLSLRPFFGLKGTWQKQSLDVDYDVIGSSNIESANTNDFWGVGPMGGVDTTWHLPGTWSLFADVGISSLWGAFTVKRKDTISDPKIAIYHVEDVIHTVKPVLEMQLGIRKEEWFCADRYHFSLQVGWEQQVWFDQNQFDFCLQNRQGNLTTQGVTAKARFDF